MHIQRANPYFPAASTPQASADAPGPSLAGGSDTGAGSSVSATPVRKLPAAQLQAMTLEKQLELGRDRGVFTKITISKEGLLAARADQASAGRSPDFVASAVTTMKDFEDGFAALKEGAADATLPSADYFASKFRGLQQAAARLNVFA